MTIQWLCVHARLNFVVLTIILALLPVNVTGVQVRLAGSTIPGAGRVEVYHQGEWGTVCDDSWDDNDAGTVCRSLGWSDGKAYGSAKFGRGSGRIWLDDVGCGTWSYDLSQCSHHGWGSHNCGHGEDAGVWCVREGSVILAGNQVTGHSGRVEVYHNAVFGTICDDSFDNNDADVICKMLGFPSGGVAHGGAKFGEGQGQIWLDDLACGESASWLHQCSLSWGVHNCQHSEDAGVFCFQNAWTTSPCSVTCGSGTQEKSITCTGFGCIPRSKTSPCLETVCPVDGQWGIWTSWTSCTVSCGSGTRTRSRECNNPAPAHNGRSCSGENQGVESCSAGIMCPVDGQWGLWSGWTSCSVSCGNGTRARSRQCNNPAPAHNGRSCPGDDYESEGCSSGIMCPIDGKWGSWNSWTPCSITCENGTRTRSRQCDNPAPAYNGQSCHGDQSVTEECTSDIMCPIDGQWSHWNDWVPCSVSCENGTRTRSRQCDNPAPAYNGQSCHGNHSVTEECTSDIMCPIDGEWGPWNDWTFCSVSCENGTRARSRQCNNPAPAQNGHSCVGENSDTERCATGVTCPVDGEWADWSAWSMCSVSCENGTRTRARECLNPAPAHGGRYCLGDQKESEGCHPGIMCPVDGNWGLWHDWTACSVSCENGTRTRSRLCDNPVPVHNGRSCPGYDLDSEECSAGTMCPIDGQWSQWNDWSSCSVSCENGTRKRSRLCNNPAPAYNGIFCRGDQYDSEHCTYGTICPIDGQWGKWTEWSLCSVTCECGEKLRSRVCDNPYPEHGGMNCTGNNTDTTPCGIDMLCPGSCGKDRLMCTDKRTCISVSMSCDGVKQCPDGSDEFNCIGRNLLYMPTFEYLFSSDSTRLVSSPVLLVAVWLFIVQ